MIRAARLAYVHAPNMSVYSVCTVYINVPVRVIYSFQGQCMVYIYTNSAEGFTL